MFHILFAFLTALTVPQKPSLQEGIILKREFIYEKAPFAECHASSVETTDDGLIAAWFGGSKEGNADVEIWISRCRDGKWTDPVSVAGGIQPDGRRYPCWNPVLFQIPQGPLLLFYKVGPSPSRWWGMLKKSVDGGQSWSEAVRLPDGVLGPVKNKPFLASDGRLICPSSTELSPDEGWRLHFEVTPDEGQSWAMTPQLPDPDSLNAIQPSILDHGEGVLQAVARSKDGGVTHSWSYDNGRTWGKVRPLGLPNPNSGTDAVTLREGFHVLVYNHSDRPANKWSGLRSPLNVAVSADGVHWENIVELERLEDGKGELSYPAVIQGRDNLIHITYTWKRRKIRHVILDPEIILNKYPELRKEIERNKEARMVQSVIFDTDVGNDIDDVLALAMLYNYQKRKKVSLLGITINKANKKTVPFIDIMDHWYGDGNTPVGFIGAEGPAPEDGKYLESVVTAENKNGEPLFKRTMAGQSAVPEGWKLQRKLLSERPDHSVTVISVGFLSNLYRLLKSGPDEYSVLSGYELVRKKVRLLSVMAGDFKDTARAEYNVKNDVPAAAYVFENWPGRIVTGGWEVGAGIKYPAASIEEDFDELHPLRIGYGSFDSMPYDRPCWDLISVFVAVEGCRYGLSLSKPGVVKVSPEGCTTFSERINGPHQCLQLDPSGKNGLVHALVEAVTGKKKR